MEASIACAKAGVTTGEWGGAARRFRRIPRPDRRRPRRAHASRARRHRPRLSACRGSSAGGSSSWSASRGSTAIPMAPSRSPAGARRRHGGGLRRHPAHPGGIVKAALEEACMSSVFDPVGQPLPLVKDVLAGCARPGLATFPWWWAALFRRRTRAP